MKSHARVVVIGGGIVGCSVLYHLAKGGWSDVVLVEKSELTAGSTWHASGNVPYFSLGIDQTRLHKYSVDLYQRLEQETGQGTGFHTTGSLRLATTQARMDEYKHHGGKAKWLGIPYEIIGPSEAKEYYPLLNTEGLLGVVWNPNDGYTDPAGTTMALAKGARDNGATIYRRTPVTGLEDPDPIAHRAAAIADGFEPIGPAKAQLVFRFHALVREPVGSLPAVARAKHGAARPLAVVDRGGLGRAAGGPFLERVNDGILVGVELLALGDQVRLRRKVAEAVGVESEQVVLRFPLNYPVRQVLAAAAAMNDAVGEARRQPEVPQLLHRSVQRAAVRGVDRSPRRAPGRPGGSRAVA